jgi:hypothetical protein
MENEHPASMTARAMKQTLPDRAIVTRDARVMVNTATSMFTLYLSTMYARCCGESSRPYARRY